MDIAKRLAFDDLSVTLSRLVEDEQNSELKAKLLELVSAYEQHAKKADDGFRTAKDQALKQLQVTGGKQLLKRQLQSLKSSLQNLGQKESFSEAILSFSEAYDFKPEADRTATALESAEEDLKDLKKANHQDEEHLREAIQLIEQYQDQQAQVLTRLDRKLDATAKEFAALGATKAAPLTPLPSAINEDELESLLAQQQALAMKLEEDLARAEASCQDLEGDLQANSTEMCHMEAEITRMKATQHDEAKIVEQRHADAIAWCDLMRGIVSQLTGVSLESIEEDCVCLRITQQQPTPSSSSSQAPAPATSHLLVARLQPSSSQLESATLDPPLAGLPVLVEFSKETGGGLPLLLTMVREQLLASSTSAS